jgi:hypothetical protein
MPNSFSEHNFALAARGYCHSEMQRKASFPLQALVCKLEKYMMQLVQIMHKVVELTIRYENHRIGKDN